MKQAPIFTDDEIRVSIATWHLCRVQRAVDDAKAEQKDMVSRVQEAYGVKWSDVKAALAQTKGNSAQRQEALERRASILSAIGAPVQMDLFDDVAVGDNDAEAAYRKGWFAACTGELLDPCEADMDYNAGYTAFHEARKNAAAKD